MRTILGMMSVGTPPVAHNNSCMKHRYLCLILGEGEREGGTGDNGTRSIDNDEVMR